ncbi:hypothetical protein ITJ42_16055 [Clavibacter michiganensis subsp. phaseoli]|uniref:Uncharacterized protein n=1 Tax=Clavibacter phaseoli TaxID=1734031 RepID=A0A8I0VIR2_9MICO|nr:hypothetical protein [Clavibacter phaseoli]MBF4632734.1 hypothetical protein [Clavibacter phaseoli]
MDHEIDDLLGTSRHPVTPHTAELQETLAALIDDVGETVADARRRRRRRATKFGVGLASVSLVLGGVTAAAAAGGWNVLGLTPWTTSDTTEDYTLPSSAECSVRITNITGGDPEAVSAAARYLHEVDVVAVADIEGEIERQRADSNVYVNPSGTEEPAGYGTKHYNADDEFNTAVMRATENAVRDEIKRQGFPDTALGDSLQMESKCTGFDGE